jgi:hypothetical protein
MTSEQTPKVNLQNMKAQRLKIRRPNHPKVQHLSKSYSNC